MIPRPKPFALIAAVVTGLLTMNTALAEPPAPTSPANTPAAASSSDQPRDGQHDFDFWLGEWKVQHRKLMKRLVNSHDWIEYEGTSSVRLVLGGQGAVDDNTLPQPNGPYHTLGIRAYDPKTAQWTLWWLDSRMASASLEPALHGHFENGIGTFYADETIDGKPIRVRFTWSDITADSARGEQAFSADGGKTWEPNWIMHWQRVK